MSENLKKTPLYNEHVKLNAKIVPFSNWEMPLNYSDGIIEEAFHTRKKASLFDTSHMGEFYFKGDLDATNLDFNFSFKLAEIKIGKGKYGFLLNEHGGVIDDLIIFKLDTNEFLIVVNAGTYENDFKVIKNSLKGDYIFEDRSAKLGKIDVQGPLSKVILEKVLNIESIGLPYFGIMKINFHNQVGYLARSGYTGELGFEVYLPNNEIVKLWQILIAEPDVKPAGLGARDILRLEKGYSLYGHELNEEINPIEADLSKFVDLEKEFRGKSFLMKNGLKRIKTAFKTESRRSPRAHYKVYYQGKEIGEVTSGTYSPFLEKGIGLGYIKPEFNKIDQPIELGDDKLKIPAVITKLPFY